jgi:7,8-dihydroneopterin aldolase/epimerase/oxygenase
LAAFANAARAHETYLAGARCSTGYAAAVADLILLEGVQIPAALGVTAAERRMRRPVLIDAALERDLRSAGRSDRIGTTIDYKDVYDAIEAIAAGQDHRLVEALAERIATALLARFEVDAVVVSVRKSKPFAGVLEHAGVRIRRERGA